MGVCQNGCANWHFSAWGMCQPSWLLLCMEPAKSPTDLCASVCPSQMSNSWPIHWWEHRKGSTQSTYNCPCRNAHTVVQKQDLVVRVGVRFLFWVCCSDGCGLLMSELNLLSSLMEEHLQSRSSDYCSVSMCWRLSQAAELEDCHETILHNDDELWWLTAVLHLSFLTNHTWKHRANHLISASFNITFLKLRGLLLGYSVGAAVFHVQGNHFTCNNVLWSNTLSSMYTEDYLQNQLYCTLNH